MTALRSESSPPKFIATSGEGRFPAALYLRMAGLLGAQRVLAKPFESEQLLAAVQSVLGEI
jgi:CheY-like chemotaxis protein